MDVHPHVYTNITMVMIGMLYPNSIVLLTQSINGLVKDVDEID